MEFPGFEFFLPNLIKNIEYFLRKFEIFLSL